MEHFTLMLRSVKRIYNKENRTKEASRNATEGEETSVVY